MKTYYQYERHDGNYWEQKIDAVSMNEAKFKAIGAVADALRSVLQKLDTYEWQSTPPAGDAPDAKG